MMMMPRTFCSDRCVTLGLYPKGTGVIRVQELEKGGIKTTKTIEKKEGFKCGTFGASSLEERYLATGDFGGMVSIWDLEAAELPIWSTTGHQGLVNCMDGIGGLDIGYGAPEIATGGRDGSVKVWDPRINTPVVHLEPGGEEKRECWTVCFGNSYNDAERVLCAGYDNGDIKMFDLRTNQMRWEANAANGVVSIDFDRRDIEMNKMCVTTLESKFRVYDLRTQHPTEGFAHLSEKAHKSTVWLCKHLPQNRDLFMTTGGNGGLNIYKYGYPSSRTEEDSEGKTRGVAGTVELLNAKIISTQPVVSFDWSPDKEGLAVMSCLDQTMRVYICTKLNLY